jgi:hypothetical protein
MAWNYTYGVAQHYRARWVQRSVLVELSATGVLPCHNYHAAIEPRQPDSSAAWNMLFCTQDICLPAVKPFSVMRTFAFDSGGSPHISVFDAVGEHKVAIKNDESAHDAGPQKAAEQWSVYARLPKNAGAAAQGCFIVPENSLVSAIYYLAFGPAEREACDSWLAEHCEASAQPSANVVWPLDDVLPWPWKS